MTIEDGSSQEQNSGGVNESNQAQKQTGGVKTVKIGDIEIPEDLLQKHIDDTIKDRINEVKDKERSKYKDYNDLKAAKAKLDEIEKSKLSEEEKKKAELDKLQKQIEEKDRILKEKETRDIKRSKIEQAIADGKMKLPKGKTIESLVKRMIGSTDEEIEVDLAEIMSFFPPDEPSKGIGGGTQQPPQVKQPDVKEQIANLTAQAAKETDPVKRTQLQDTILSLKMRAGGFVIA